MTNSHDVLYPSKDRTISLVRAGEYYRYLDEFTRSINAFRDLWTPVKFSTFPTHEIVWCTYQYLRLCEWKWCQSKCATTNSKLTFCPCRPFPRRHLLVRVPGARPASGCSRR